MPLAEIPDAKSVSRTYTTHRLLTKKEEILKLIEVPLVHFGDLSLPCFSLASKLKKKEVLERLKKI